MIGVILSTFYDRISDLLSYCMSFEFIITVRLSDPLSNILVTPGLAFFTKSNTVEAITHLMHCRELKYLNRKLLSFSNL